VAEVLDIMTVQQTALEDFNVLLGYREAARLAITQQELW